ncbi:MAG: hypothetical protein WAP35_03175 [Solirubrobacterales bacterium]
MSANERKAADLEDLIRLRRVQRELPPNRDLVTVGANLERRIGPTVSQRLAAELLGVSHTALGRWTKTGDLPLVLNAQGREEIPTRYLVDLAIAVDRTRGPNGHAHSLEPVMRENRQKAERLRARGAAYAGPRDGAPHDRANRLALAYHREVARNLSRAQADDALRTVWRLRDEGRMHDRYADQWERILAGSIVEIKSALVDESEAGFDLRQNSPFAGTLSEPERREILAQVVG